MKTKREVVAKLDRLHKGARIVNNDMAYDTWDIDIEAPKNYHWDDGPHNRVVCQFKSGSKQAFWQDVYDLLDDLVAYPCDGSNCGNCDNNECLYWRHR